VAGVAMNDDQECHLQSPLCDILSSFRCEPQGHTADLALLPSCASLHLALSEGVSFKKSRNHRTQRTNL
jgi:hypothetical protein